MAAESSTQGLSTEEKTILKLRKKLREIDKIEARLAEGDRVDPLQQEKVSRKAAVLSELEALEQNVLAVHERKNSKGAVHMVDSLQDVANKLQVSCGTQAPARESPIQSLVTTASGSDCSGTVTPPNTPGGFDVEAESQQFVPDVGHVPDVHKFAAKVFTRLDADGDGWLSSPELLAFAAATGFDDGHLAWDELFDNMCQGAPGLNLTDFSVLFKALMQDPHFCEAICTAYPDDTCAPVGPQAPYRLNVHAAAFFPDFQTDFQKPRPHNPHAGQRRFPRRGFSTDAAVRPRRQLWPATFKEVLDTCSHEEVVTWVWRQGGYDALYHYLGYVPN